MLAKQSDTTSDTQRDAARPPSILIVDPDGDARAMYAADLALSGWIVDGVTDGRVALAKAITDKPAVVVTETRLQCISGFELCRLLRRDPDTQGIPIVVVTGDADPTEIARAREASADRVLTKPCLPDTLTREVEEILRAPIRVRSSGSIDARSNGWRRSAWTSSSRPHRLSRSHERGVTATPPKTPPELLCPRCDRSLVYEQSYIGGVSARHSEQWDEYRCSNGCGAFQYRHRTRKLRPL